MRLFWAVFPPSAVLKDLDFCLGNLPQKGWGCRWTSRDQRHVTLHFLGDLPAERLGDLRELAEEAAGGVSAFRATLRGVGAFPGWARPKTLFVNVEDAAGSWKTLAGTLQTGLRKRGFRVEAGVFRPHVTLARVKNAEEAVQALPPLAAALKPFVGAWDVEGFDLVESRLEATGAVYRVVHSFPLRKAG